MSTTLRRPLLAAIAGASIVLYAGLVPPARTQAVMTSIAAFSSLQPDTALYVERFVLSLGLLGAVPLSAYLLLWPASVGRERIPGLSRPVALFSPAHVAGYIALGCAIGGVGVLSPGLAGFYPYHPRLPELAREVVWVFPSHALAYLVAYYLPWELLFRGLLVIPFLPEGRASSESSGSAYAVASLQALPSALLHFGHPLSESLSAVFFGLFAGWLVVRTRSIYPVLMIHAAAGVTLDFLIVMTS